MAYQTYITEAIVCGSQPHNTSDCIFLLFTREAGMLYATARSVREERSKQRFALQVFSYVRATLVHGRAGWRIAGVEPLRSCYAHAHVREARALIRNTVLLLRRTMHGETPYEVMFDDVRDVLVNTYDETQYEKLELALSVRVLDALGYIAPDIRYAPILTSVRARDSISQMTEDLCTIVRSAVHHALKESQL